MTSDPATPAAAVSSNDAAALARRRVLTLIVVAAALWIAHDFLAPLAWALVLAIAEWPLHRWLLRRLPGRVGLVSLILTLATALVVILPLSLVAVSLVGESQAAIAWVQGVQQHGLSAPAWLHGIPLVGDKATQAWQQHVGTPQAADALLGGLSAGSVLGWLRSAAGTIASESGLFLLTLVALGSLLGAGETLAKQTERVARAMLGDFGGRFAERMTAAVRGTVIGTVLVSVGEGALIGVGYLVADVPQPVLFATATVVLAMIPGGAWLAFALASLILLGQGHGLAAALLFGFSAAVMTLGDNAIQPRVIGSAVHLPFLLALVGTLGGLASLGLVGLFVGPVVMVAAVLIWQEWTATPTPAPATR